MTTRTFPALVLGLASSLALAACGDDGGGDNPDASDTPDAEAQPDAPGPSGCDYDEADDAGNGTTGEATGLSPSAGGATICGTLTANAPDANAITDSDKYTFNVGTAGPVLLRVDADVGTTLALVYSGTSLAAGGQGSFRGDGIYVGDHLVYALDLEAGDFTVEVTGLHNAQPTADVDYTLTILTDMPDTRCATVTGDATFVEAGDGAGNAGNDMILVNWNAPQGTSPVSATTTPTDNPEMSGEELAITAGMSYKLTGEAGVPNGGATDSYQDRDVYIIATGANTNEISIRGSWTGAEDLDVMLFEVPTGDTVQFPINTNAATIDNPEFATAAVLPSTTYWLWVGHYDAAAPVAVPYEATICGHTYTP